jgi:hypothetical protein
VGTQSFFVREITLEGVVSGGRLSWPSTAILFKVVVTKSASERFSREESS